MEEKEFFQWLEVLVYSLQFPEWPLEEKISRQQAIALIANFFSLDPEDPDFIQKAFSKLSEFKIEKETALSIPPNLKELVAAYEEHLATEEAKIKTNPSYWEYYQEILKETLKKLKNPSLAKAVSQQITQKVAQELPQVTHPQAFEETVKPEEYKTTLREVVKKNLPPEVSLPPETIKRLAETTRPLAAKLAAIPRPLPTSPIPSPISEEIPPSVITKIAVETQGVAFKPVFTLLHPPTAISAVKKIALAPIVKPLQWMVKIAPENIPEEIKKFVLEGLTSKDIQESINAFQEAGLSSKHPKIDQLKNQKDKLTSFESSHPVLSFILRHYHEFSKKTGSRQIQEPKTGLWLPRLSPSPTWQDQKGYASALRENLNRLGVFLKTHQWLPSPRGRIIHLVLPDKIVRFFSFGKIQSFIALKKITYQKIIQPVLIWLGKTAIGKAIKTGVKKLFSWGLAKLGISLAGAAAGVATGPPGWVVTLISFLPNIISWAKRGIKKLLEKPELAIFLGIGLVGLPILVPMLPVLKTILTAAGIISAGIGFLAKSGSFLAGIAGKIGGFLSSAANTIGGFFSSLSTISLPSILPIIAVGGSLGLTATLTLTTIITTGSAFLEEGKGGETSSYIGSPVSPRGLTEASHLAESVIWTLNNCGITAINKTTWEETKKCLYNSSLPNKEIIIDQFRFSVFEVGPGLQCVGFVRGVMAALGKDPGGGRHARGYLDPPTPSGYYRANTDMNNVQIGDLVILRGESYGHIAIVVNIVEKNGIKYLHVAEAIGTNNGIIRINEVNAIYFDGFLRPI